MTNSGLLTRPARPSARNLSWLARLVFGVHRQIVVFRHFADASGWVFGARNPSTGSCGCVLRRRCPGRGNNCSSGAQSREGFQTSNNEGRGHCLIWLPVPKMQERTLTHSVAREGSLPFSRRVPFPRRARDAAAIAKRSHENEQGTKSWMQSLELFQFAS